MRLIVNGWLDLDLPGGAPVEVWREMQILGSDGAEMGTVAAVEIDPRDGAATHVLLSRRGDRLVYHLVPLSLIASAGADGLRLRIPGADVNRLPRRAPAADPSE